MKFIILCILLAVLGCSHPSTLLCDKGLDYAVMDRLLRQGIDTNSSFPDCPSLPGVQARIYSLRDWARQQPDRCVRATYLDWLNYFDNQAHEAGHECRTHSEQKEYEQYEAQQRADSEANAEYEATHTIPTPPEP